jgi:alkanesulfonate monooxygenase SsuD/methylene tetrahydromethanopterin reductase-like flavin-dependent oxidoreductase (luciferase family)
VIFVAVITPIIGRTHEEAVAKYQEAQKYASVEAVLAFWSGGSGIDINKFDLDREIVASDAKIDHRVHSFADSLSYRGDDAQTPTPRNIGKIIAIGANGPTPVGIEAEVADEIERWVDIADLDGFNIGYVTTPGIFVDVVDLLVPKLRRRGRYAPKGESTGPLTLRERVYGKRQSKLRDDHLGHTYRYENLGRYAKQDKIPKE